MSQGHHRSDTVSLGKDAALHLTLLAFRVSFSVWAALISRSVLILASKEENSIRVSDDAIFHVAGKLSLKTFPRETFQKCFEQSFEYSIESQGYFFEGQLQFE